MVAPRILVASGDGPLARKIDLALSGAGFDSGTCGLAPEQVVAAVASTPPQLVLALAEPGSSELTALLVGLESGGHALLPVALLSHDVSEDRFVRPLRTGVVELLQAPFSPRLHLGRLRVLLGELAERPGLVHGRGEAGELAAFVQHLMRMRRSGGLEVGPGREGRAYFVRGALKSARLGAQADRPALAAMMDLDAPWSFTEGAEGTAGVVDLQPPDGDEPLLSTYQAGVQVPPLLEDDVPAIMGVPLSDAPGDEAPTASQAAVTPILFVDDEVAVVEMLATYFSKRGYPVDTAADGVEAMQKLLDRPFEVVVADLNMPRLDGWGLLRLIREDVRTREVPVALFSAQDSYREALRLAQAGAQAYFPKSLRLAALEQQVVELVEPRRRFLRVAAPDAGLTFDFGALGPQWVLRALAQVAFNGQLDARDPWASWRLGFESGRLARATAKAGTTAMTGDRALAGLLMSRRVEGTLSARGATTDEHFSRQSTVQTLARLVPWLNDERQKAKESELSRAKALTVHDELYRLYVSVGPPASLPIARLLCELKLTPAEVMGRLQVSAMEVAGVVKDLLSRGVVSLES